MRNYGYFNQGGSGQENKIVRYSICFQPLKNFKPTENLEEKTNESSYIFYLGSLIVNTCHILSLHIYLSIHLSIAIQI